MTCYVAEATFLRVELALTRDIPATIQKYTCYTQPSYLRGFEASSCTIGLDFVGILISILDSVFIDIIHRDSHEIFDLR